MNSLNHFTNLLLSEEGKKSWKVLPEPHPRFPEKQLSSLSLFIMYPQIQWDLVNASILGEGKAVAILVTVSLELFCVASIYLSKGIT